MDTYESYNIGVGYCGAVVHVWVGDYCHLHEGL